MGYSIFTEADSWDELREAIRDAVDCHFEAGEIPPVIRMSFVSFLYEPFGTSCIQYV
jgi:hypothetical protein